MSEHEYLPGDRIEFLRDAAGNDLSETFGAFLPKGTVVALEGDRVKVAPDGRDYTTNVFPADIRPHVRTATAEQIAEARHWIADAFPANPLDAGDTHPVYDESAEYVQRYVQQHYEGGWAAFLADGNL